MKKSKLVKVVKAAFVGTVVGTLGYTVYVQQQKILSLEGEIEELKGSYDVDPDDDVFDAADADETAKRDLFGAYGEPKVHSDDFREVEEGGDND